MLMMLTQLSQGLSDFSTMQFLFCSHFCLILFTTKSQSLHLIYIAYNSVLESYASLKNRISTYIIGFILHRRLYLFISSCICIKIDIQLFILYFSLKFKTFKIYLVIIPALAIGCLSMISCVTLTVSEVWEHACSHVCVCHTFTSSTQIKQQQTC